MEHKDVKIGQRVQIACAVREWIGFSGVVKVITPGRVGVDLPALAPTLRYFMASDLDLCSEQPEGT